MGALTTRAHSAMPLPAGGALVLLEKWYGDWIGPAGPNILYAATLSLGPLRLGFEGRHAPGMPARGRFGRGGALPRLEGDILTWPSEAGTFRWSGAASRPHGLGARHRGAVTWDVVVPAGAVSGPGIDAGQRGYAERLELRVAPWALGIELLRWGRFCGSRSSLAWVEWVGADPVAVALLDGRAVPLRRASLAHVEVDGAMLDLAPARPFVEEPLKGGLLRDMPWPRRIRPLAFLRGIERKYAVRGILRSGTGAAEEGDVLLEEVAWPR